MTDIVDAVNGCPVNTAGRPLTPEEVQLRTTWINAVFLMLEHIGHDSTTTNTSTTTTAKRGGDGIITIGDNVRSTYAPILPDLVALKESDGAGGAKSSSLLDTQEFVNQHAHVLPAIIQEDVVQMAIVSQTIKVLWYTLVVLEDERLANDDDDDPRLQGVARPQIPRGQGIN